MMRAKLILAIVLVLSQLVSACGMQSSVPETPAEARVWPAAPAAPRIRYVRSLSGPQDLGIEKPCIGAWPRPFSAKPRNFSFGPPG